MQQYDEEYGTRTGVKGFLRDAYSDPYGPSSSRVNIALVMCATLALVGFDTWQNAKLTSAGVQLMSALLLAVSGSYVGSSFARRETVNYSSDTIQVSSPNTTPTVNPVANAQAGKANPSGQRKLRLPPPDVNP